MKEINGVRQVPGEHHRRWFFAHAQDLLVWVREDGALAAFQLAYGKTRNEHALRWKEGAGFTHHSVDDGEGRTLTKGVPLLFPNGPFEARRILDEFLELAAEVPPEIVEFVRARITEHPEFGQAPSAER